MFRNIICSLVIIGVVSGCSESVEPQPATFHKIFTGQTKKTWKTTRFEWTDKGANTVNLGLENCEADDTFVFYANEERKYEVYDGSSKCAPEDPDLLYEGEWSFSNANATLTIALSVLPYGALPYYVREVNSKNMTLEIFLNEGSYRIYMQSVSEE